MIELPGCCFFWGGGGGGGIKGVLKFIYFPISKSGGCGHHTHNGNGKIITSLPISNYKKYLRPQLLTGFQCECFIKSP